jgi:TetR/AcrR family transcriptional repressor of mexJK operon
MIEQITLRLLARNIKNSMRTWSEDHPKARLLERKQEAIKAAAKELFLQHGYANTTMEMVAAQANVSIMTLYRHFRSKDILFQAVIQRFCASHEKDTSTEFWQGNPSEVLCQVGRLRLAFILDPEEISLYRVIIGALEHFPEVGQMYYHIRVEKQPDLLIAYLQELHRQGLLHIPNPQFSAHAFLTLLQDPLIERARLGATPASTNEEIEQHIDACVTFFLAAHQANHP